MSREFHKVHKKINHEDREKSQDDEELTRKEKQEVKEGFSQVVS